MSIETNPLKNMSHHRSAAHADVATAPTAARASAFKRQNGSVPKQTTAPAETAPDRTLYRRHGKRMFDVVVVLFAAPIWIPAIVILAAFIMLDGGNPFYSQARVGKFGRSFRMWKLRSMVNGAEELLEAHLAAHPEARAEWNEKQKLSADPRITRFGRFIRKTSLDELPQLWNVLIGEMSLVGPRPMMLDQEALYSGSAYYTLRPGVTGTWQVYARNRTGFASRATFDDMYSRDLSLATDIYLILKTVPSVLLKRGG